MAVLDSTFLIEIERGAARATQLLAELLDAGEALRVPAAAWVEFLYRLTPQQRSKAARLLGPATRFEPFDRALADQAIEIQHALRTAGGLLSWHDLQIAATAVHHDEPLVTNDAAFERVPRLRTLRH
jgi:predicted nucleic acid-binding protein